MDNWVTRTFFDGSALPMAIGMSFASLIMAKLETDKLFTLPGDV
jgi:hypothetical protein